MKIFIISNALTGGGAERAAVNLANGLVKRGHEVILFTDLRPAATYITEPSVYLSPLCRDNSHKLLKWLEAIVFIRKKIKKDPPDVIIGIMHLCSLAGRIAALLLPVPVVLTIHHAVGHKNVRYSLITRMADRWLPSLYPCVTVLSEADRLFYHDKANVSVLPNTLTFSPASSLPTKENMILAVGRLSAVYVKGWDLLMEAWQMIAKGYPDWRLVIIGGGSNKDKNTIRKMISEKNVEQQTILVDYKQEILPWYRRAAIFVSSSRSEGQPMVLLEAMSQGCAPVATDNDNRTQEIITTETEGLICKTDALSIAQGIRKVLDDNILRDRLQRGAVQRSYHYSPNQVITQWEELIKSLKKKNL